MNLELENIRREIEHKFDIPFNVTGDIVDNSPHYKISPLSEGKNLFSLNIHFENQIRIVISLMLHEYSLPFVESLEESNDEQKYLCSEYANLLHRSKGAKLLFKINDHEIDFSRSDSWPINWNKLEVRFTKIPIRIGDDEDINYLSPVFQWAPLFLGLILSLATIVPLDFEQDQMIEGGKSIVVNTKYERNPLNRLICLRANGYSCKICGINFKKIYGEIGHDFIHVHHIDPVSKHSEKYLMNPVTDLVPVCPNCHAMLHRKDPPYKPSEIMANDEE